MTCREWVLPVDAHQLLYTPIELVLVLIFAHQARVANLSRKCARVPGHLASTKSTRSRFEGIVLSAMKQTKPPEKDCIKQPAPAFVNANVASVVPPNESRLARSADRFMGLHTIDMANGVEQAPHDRASGNSPLHAVAGTWGEPETEEAPPSRPFNLLHQSTRALRNRPMTPPIMSYLKPWLKQSAGLSKFKTQWRQVRPTLVSPTLSLGGQYAVSHLWPLGRGDL
jgi:hypothetical protein